LNTLINILMVIVVWGCFYLASRINSLLKGGELSPPWFIISLSLGIFSLGLIFDFFSAISVTAGGILKLGGLSLFAIGLIYIRKALN